MSSVYESPSQGLRWRHLVLAALTIGSFVIIFLQPPIPQDQAYHYFADKRGLFGIPNFGDVASNLAFIAAGAAGLWVLSRKHQGIMHKAWMVMFAGITLVGVASSYYHWAPSDETLVMDRMTLTVGFMGLFVALLGEFVSGRFAILLWPAAAFGAASVLYWKWFDDLRLYAWVQFFPLLIVPFLFGLYRSRFSHQWMIAGAAGLYGLAKLTELGDKAIFNSTGGIVSGHTLKHLIAGAACAAIAYALHVRVLAATVRQS